MTPKFD